MRKVVEDLDGYYWKIPEESRRFRTEKIKIFEFYEKKICYYYYYYSFLFKKILLYNIFIFLFFKLILIIDYY